jgi:hypothetical protein
MKWMGLIAALAVGAAMLPAGPAQAAGCLKGAVVGGVAGHYLAHHGWLGAAAGCLIGRHEANRPARSHYAATRRYYAGYR